MSSTRDDGVDSGVLGTQFSHQTSLVPPLLIPVKAALDKLMQRLDLFQRLRRAVERGERIYGGAAVLCNLANLAVPVHADDNLTLAHILLGQIGIDEHHVATVVVREADAEGMVLHGQPHGLALADAVDGHILAFDGDIRAAKVLERCDEGNAAGVNQVAVVVQDVDVGAHGKTFAACYYTEGLGV